MSMLTDRRIEKMKIEEKRAEAERYLAVLTSARNECISRLHYSVTMRVSGLLFDAED